MQRGDRGERGQTEARFASGSPPPCGKGLGEGVEQEYAIHVVLFSQQEFQS